MAESMTRYEIDSAPMSADIIEKVVAVGDLSTLTSEQRLSYYNAVCESLGLNPLTRPFEYITLNGKLTFYARKDATDQLRRQRGISIVSLEREIMDDIMVVTVHAKDDTGKEDTDIGAVSVAGLKGQEKANAWMKAITKGKRRVTLSLAGLGFLDETEVEDIPEQPRSALDAINASITPSLTHPEENPLLTEPSNGNGNNGNGGKPTQQPPAPKPAPKPEPDANASLAILEKARKRFYAKAADLGLGQGDATFPRGWANYHFGVDSRSKLSAGQWETLALDLDKYKVFRTVYDNPAFDLIRPSLELFVLSWSKRKPESPNDLPPDVYTKYADKLQGALDDTAEFARLKKLSVEHEVRFGSVNDLMATLTTLQEDIVNRWLGIDAHGGDPIEQALKAYIRDTFGDAKSVDVKYDVRNHLMCDTVVASLYQAADALAEAQGQGQSEPETPEAEIVNPDLVEPDVQQVLDGVDVSGMPRAEDVF